VSDSARIKQVWSVCFGDSDAFIDAYFRYAARPENGRAYFDEEGNILSDMFGLDFAVNLTGRRYHTKFLAGCATMPAARKKDLMKNLLRDALGDYKRQGCAVAALHPFLHSFYRKFGFETIAYVDRREAQGGGGNEAVIADGYDALPVEKMMRAYADYTGRFDNYFVRDARRFDAWLRLLFADDGKAAYIDQGADGFAYALYYEHESHTEVFELVCSGKSQLDKMIRSLPAKKVRYFLPGTPGAGEEFTMLRALDPVTVLKEYPYAGGEVDFTIEIEDDFLETGYQLAVSRGKAGRAEVLPVQGGCDIRADMAAFSRLVAGAGGNDIPGIAQEVFPSKKSCFFETY
jgi:predicted acetyltransferase